jgi:hypothetical protein
MKIVTVKVTTEDGKDNSNTSMVIERDRGTGYVRIDGRDVVTNKDKEQTFRLRHGERLVIEAYQADAVEYDRDQGAAYKTSNQREGKLDSPTNKATPAEQKMFDQEAARMKKEGVGEQSPSRPKSSGPIDPRSAIPETKPTIVDAQGRVRQETSPQSSVTTGPGSGIVPPQPLAPASPPSKANDPNPGLRSSKDK